MRRCGGCGTLNDLDSTTCVECGRQIRVPAKRRLSTEWKVVLAAGALGLALLAGCLTLLDDEPEAASDVDPISTTTAEPQDLSANAYTICKEFVLDRLAGPSTAEFPGLFINSDEIDITGTGNGPYTVVAHVDAENGFGATRRAPFVCVVTANGDDWRLEDLTIQD